MKLDALSGETLAHFHIEHRLGQGGMGIVYRAEDVLLRRPVALKVMQPEQMADEHRRARFLREARTVANLVHPNIATVYEVGEAGGAIYIAMELVEGDSLRTLLERGPVDLGRAMRWFVDIARALARAHEAGVVHCDLKPDNVMLTREGDVKLLDFGIAKALAPESVSGDPALDPTAVQPVTAEGAVVGTPEYMSPEQARGERLDVRSDLFSFGVLSYEILAGRSPFRRGNFIETAIAISRDPAPSLRAVRGEVPQELERVLLRCLAKERGDRPANGGELLAALRGIETATPVRSPLAQTLEGVAALTLPPKRWRRKATLGAAIVLTAGALASWAHLPHGASVPAALDAGTRPMATTTAPPPRAFTEWMIGGGQANNGWTFDLSPDGKRAVFDDGAGAWIKTLPEGAPVPLPIPREAVGSVVTLAFTGDDSIAYVVSPSDAHTVELWTLDLHASAPVRVRTDPISVTAASITRDGRRVAYASRGGLHLGEVRGPALKRVVASDARSFLEPVWSPANDGLVYIELGEDGLRTALVWISADGERTSRVLDDASVMGTFGGAGLAFSAPDRLLTLRYDHGETSLVELPFGPHGAIVGPSQTLFVWHGELISQLKLGGDRIGFSRGRANASVVRFGLAADGSHAEGTPKSVIDSSGSLRPLGWTDATHIAILEEHDDDFDHVVLASLDGAVEPYVPGPLRSAWLVPNGDVLYWAGSRANDAGAGSPDAGGCTLMRHVASDRSEHPAPQSGTTCDSPIRCARSRCIAQEAGEDLINTFRDWSSENGATGPILVQIDGPHIRWGLSSDGRWLAAYDGRDPALTLYDLAHDSARKVIPTRTPQMLQGVDFLPGARRLVVVGYGNAGKDMFGLGTLGVDGTSQTIATDPVVWSTSPQVAPDGRSFVVGRKDFGTKLWALEPR